MVELKKKVRRAMKILEAGKAVAAFNLLKEIVEEEEWIATSKALDGIDQDPRVRWTRRGSLRRIYT